jgi:hypothetical protein
VAPVFALGEHHDAQLVYGALAMAVAMRGGGMPEVIMQTGQAPTTPPGRSALACQWPGIH